MKADNKIKAKRFFDKGCAAKDTRRFKQAKTWFIRASGLLDKKWRAICWGFSADCDEEQGKLSDALQLWRKAENCDPQNALIWRRIGSVYLDMERPKLAQRAFEKAIHIEPTAHGYVFLGSAFRRQGYFDKQKACYQSALRVDPNYEEAHYNLGACYKLDGQYAKAERYFRRAIEIDPKYALAYAELGAVLIKKRRFNEAYKMLRRAIKFEPNYYWARLYFAITNWTLGHLNEAEKQYREALRIRPNDSLAYAILGDYLSATQRKGGDKYLKKAIAIDPTNAEAFYLMAKYLHRNDREDEAIRYLKKASRKGHERAQEILAKIEKRNKDRNTKAQPRVAVPHKKSS